MAFSDLESTHAALHPSTTICIVSMLDDGFGSCGPHYSSCVSSEGAFVIGFPRQIHSDGGILADCVELASMIAFTRLAQGTQIGVRWPLIFVLQSDIRCESLFGRIGKALNMLVGCQSLFKKHED